MNIQEARKILNVSCEDDHQTIKMKFRQMMGKCHPDAVGSDHPVHIRRAQKINEAYSLLKHHANQTHHTNYANQMHQTNYTSQTNYTHHTHSSDIKNDPPQKTTWKSPIIQAAYVGRNIYLPYSLDQKESELYQHVAFGKYSWDPDEEPFAFFLRSINHASAALLMDVKPIHDIKRMHDIKTESLYFQYQIRLFQALASQYIDPVSCLHKLVAPEKIDTEGREIYRFKAFVGTQGSSEVFRAIAALTEGESIYPTSLQHNRIAVADQMGNPLGHLSLEEDAFYFCLMPFLKKKLAQVRMVVKSVMVNKKCRPFHVQAEIAFVVRFSTDYSSGMQHEQNVLHQNMVIRQILDAYKNL